MGTTYHIKAVFPVDADIDPVMIQNKIEFSLERINDLMSTYRPNSELSRFNKMQAGSMKVAPETALVVAKALELYELTSGSLDVSLGPLVNLWGFGPEKVPSVQPSLKQINQLKQDTGLHQLNLNGLSLTKKTPSLSIDLSSIAKGYGVDYVADIIMAQGAEAYMVEIGGETKSYGSKPDGASWRIAIEKPELHTRDVALIIEPQNLAVATSGDYRNFVEYQGKRRSHIIDPRTGFPIEHHLASVTVLHPSCMVADGLATSMMVMGTQAALKLANQEHIAVMLIDKSQEKLKIIYSEAFKPFVKSLES